MPQNGVILSPLPPVEHHSVRSLEVEMEELISGGALVIAGTTVRLTQDRQPFATTLCLAWLSCRERFNYLDSAIATIFAMPVGMVRAAFAHDPDILLVAGHGRSRVLASESALARLYAEFDAVADVLGTAHRSLLAASVLWLTYLAEGKSVSLTA